MKYTRITYKHDKKNNRYRFFYEAEYFEHGNTGHHVCSGNYFDVYHVTGHAVAIKNAMIPVLCCDSLGELCKVIEKETGCIPEQII